jgi:hypothetical protein
VAQNLARDSVLARVLDHHLRLAVLVLLDLDDAGREALLELLLVLFRDRSAEDDVGEEAVRRGGLEMSA